MAIHPALIAVVGPAEPDLLSAFLRHYADLGVEEFHIAFHFPDDTPRAVREDLLAAYRASTGTAPALVSTGAWHETTNAHLRDQMRAQARPGWHLLADLDEFHTYPKPLPDMIAAADQVGSPVIGGLMLDRVAADGSFPGWDPALGLDVAYPLGGFLTHFLLRGDPRKIVLARHDVHVATGQHRAPGHRPANAVPVCVHHFKWRSGVVAYLSKRVSMLGPGRPWREVSPAVRLETQRVLDHLAAHQGRVDITDPAWGFAPATTERLPAGWEAEARHIIDTWRPPAADANP